MTLFSKAIVWAILSSLAALGAKADDIKASNALICGTADHARQFMAHHQDFQGALAKVNEPGAATNCLAATIAYIPGKAVDRVERKDGIYVVTEIMIVGVGTPYGMLASQPSLAYTVLKVDEESA